MLQNEGYSRKQHLNRLKSRYKFNLILYICNHIQFLMKFTYQLFIFFLVCLSASCSKWEETPVISRLQLVNAYPDVTSLNFSINSDVDTSLNFGSSTNYKPLRAGRSTLQVSIGANPIASGDLYFAENNNYSLYILKGRNNADSLFIRTDSLPVPEVGRAKIRFANLSPAVEGIGLSMIAIGPNKDTLALPARTFPNFTPFITIDAAQGYRLSLLRDRVAVATISTQALESERSYTIIASGYASLPPGNPRGLTLRVIENR